MFKKVENNNNEEVELNPDLFKNYKIFLVSATVDGKIRKMAERLAQSTYNTSNIIKIKYNFILLWNFITFNK